MADEDQRYVNYGPEANKPKPQAPIAVGEVTGRTAKPASSKWNPLWWFGKQDDQSVGTMASAVGDEAPWYHGADPTVKGWQGPTWPQWRRFLQFNYARNPFNDNFTFYVIGVQDKNYKIEVLKGHPDPYTHQRDDVGETGWQVSRIVLPSGRTLPWVSYSGSWEFNLGWSPSGNFTAKLHPHKE